MEEIVYGFTFTNNLDFTNGSLVIIYRTTDEHKKLYDVKLNQNILAQSRPLFTDARIAFYKAFFDWQRDNEKLGRSGHVKINGYYGEFKNDFEKIIREISEK